MRLQHIISCLWQTKPVHLRYFCRDEAQNKPNPQTAFQQICPISSVADFKRKISFIIAKQRAGRSWAGICLNQADNILLTRMISGGLYFPIFTNIYRTISMDMNIRKGGVTGKAVNDICKRLFHFCSAFRRRAAVLIWVLCCAAGTAEGAEQHIISDNSILFTGNAIALEAETPAPKASQNSTAHSPLERAGYYLYQHPRAPRYHKAEIWLHRAVTENYPNSYSALASFYADEHSPLYHPKHARHYFSLALARDEPYACIARIAYFDAHNPHALVIHDTYPQYQHDLECAAHTDNAEDRQVWISRLIAAYAEDNSLRARMRRHYWQNRLSQITSAE